MPASNAATMDEVRRHNLGRLLRLLHVHGAMSRATLTLLTGLNRSTVGALTTDLVNAGLLRESEPVGGRGGAGRPSIVVEPDPRQAFAVAIDLGVKHLTVARVGLGGTVLDRRQIRQPTIHHDLHQTLPIIEELSTQMLSAAPPGAVCVGVGVGVCGMVGREDGSVRCGLNVGWHDVPLGRLLADRLGGLQVTVGNDGDLGALGEHMRGAAAGLSDIIYVSGEIGVGGGIIAGGHPLHGVGGYGGEIGHMCVNPRGRLCRCGRRGCWETEIGAEAVLESVGAAPDTDLETVIAAHAAGDRRTAAGLRRVGHWMGVGVVNLVHIFNPEIIVFGGETRAVFSATKPIVHQALATALAAPREQLRLAAAALGADSALIGAAETAFAPLLNNPLAVVTT
jgi:predicted NBD/HSP70 family sugar kinase